MRSFTVGSLFAGIGGMDLAFEAAGFRVAYQVEIDPFCRQVLAKHFPRAKRYGDIHACHHLPYVDVLTAGFPCQPFSVAGNQRGEDDPRYLIPEMLRVIEEVQPRAVLFENVPGFASLAAGRVFREFLRALARLGYDAQWGYLCAADVGAPHARKRWFCIAYRAVGVTHRQRQSESSGQQISGQNIHRNLSPCQRQRRTVLHALKPDGTVVSHAHRPRLAQWQYQPTQQTPQSQSEQSDFMGNPQAAKCQWSGQTRRWGGGFADADRRSAQSRLDRDAHGLSYRLDRHQFPAPPGQPPLISEPPRLAQNTPLRRQRVQALGNAVVPQVIYPLALEIKHWLEMEINS